MAYERIEHDAYQTEHSLGHRPLPSESRSSIMIDVRETQDPECERGQVGVDGTRADDEHPAWCSPADCFVTDEGVRVHQQAPNRWEETTPRSCGARASYSIQRTTSTSTWSCTYSVSGSRATHSAGA